MGSSGFNAKSGTTGRAGFVKRYHLWDDKAHAAGEKVVAQIKQMKLEVVRFSFADQHGILRSKTLVASEVANAFRNGVSMVTTLLVKDTAHYTVTPWFTHKGGLGMDEMSGGGDFIMVPDPTTFRVLPWTENEEGPGAGWVLCDIYFSNGKPVPFSTRQILRNALKRLGDAGYEYVAGLEVEFHVFKLEDPKLRPQDAGQPATPPEVSLLAHGCQYLTEQRMDELDPVFDLIRRGLMALDLPVRSLEVEFGPSQFEITFQPCTGLDGADAMVLMRSAVKQICRRRGYHATFMCRPGLPNMFSSGWHLHQSLYDVKNGVNALIPNSQDELLSPVGRQFVAGILEHARSACFFSTPTINGYKRYRPKSLAPDRIGWGRDNRAAMIRVVGGPGDPGTRIENRVGEPAANPYLFFASQIFSGLDGVERSLDPPPLSDSPYTDDSPLLPKSLMEVITTLNEDVFFRDRMGANFIDYMLMIKEAEVARFLSEVTDWEHKEYFEIF